MSKNPVIKFFQNLKPIYKLIVAVIGVSIIITLFFFGFQYLIGSFNKDTTNKKTDNITSGLSDLQYVNKDFLATFDPKMFKVNQIDKDNDFLHIPNSQLTLSYFEPLKQALPDILPYPEKQEFTPIIYNNKTGQYTIAKNFSPKKDPKDKFVSSDKYLKLNVNIDQLYNLSTKWVYSLVDGTIMISDINFSNPYILFNEFYTTEDFYQSKKLISLNEKEIVILVNRENRETLTQGARALIANTGDNPTVKKETRKIEFNHLVKFDIELIKKNTRENEFLYPSKYGQELSLSNFKDIIQKNSDTDLINFKTDLDTAKVFEKLPNPTNQVNSVSKSSLPEEYYLDFSENFYPLKNNRIFVHAIGALNHFYIIDINTGEVIEQNLPIDNKGWDNVITSNCNFETSICEVLNFQNSQYYKIDLSLVGKEFKFTTTKYDTSIIPDFQIQALNQTALTQGINLRNTLTLKDGEFGFWYLGKFYPVK
jgi:hypothetical protein